MKFSYLFYLFLLTLLLGGCAQKGAVAVVPSQEVQDIQEVQEVKVAMILPDKLIGRYAHTTSTAVFAYFLTREHPFVLKTFHIADESAQELERVLNSIKEQGFNYVIAPVTPKGASTIVEMEEDLTIFFPTIHKNDLTAARENIYFGAIDYRAQIEKLTPLASSPLVVMYDRSTQGKKLLKMTDESYLESNTSFQPTSRKEHSLRDKTPYDKALEPKKKQLIAYGVDKKTSNLKEYLDNNEKIQFASFFLHTPLIKSTMILSQLSIYDTKATNTLSTQINYDPLILSMTQKKDRKDLYIANSISIKDDTLVQANAMLSNDIVYDWINYASTIGADLFYHKLTGEERTYGLPIVDNQIIYPVTIMQLTYSHFKALEN